MKQRASRLTPVARAVRGSRLVDFATEWPFAEYAQSGGRMRGTWDTRPLAAPQTRLLPYAPHNLLRHSNDPNNVAWNKSNASVTAAGSEWLLTTTSTVDPYLMQEITPVTSRWTQSVTVRQGTAAKVQLRPITFYGSGQVRDYSVFFDFATETFAGSNAGADLSCSFDRLSGGRYRLHVTTAAQVSQTFAQIRVVGANASFNIGQVGLTVYVSDMQMCHGSNTEYIATAAVARTRVAPYLAHNLLRHSQVFSNAAWEGWDGGTKAAGTMTLGANVLSRVEQPVAMSTADAVVTFSLKVSVASGTARFRLKNTHGGVVDSYSSELTATTTPQVFSFTVMNSGSPGVGTQIVGLMNAADGSSNGVTFIVEWAQLNLGPLTGYVPTTTAAVPAVLDSVVQYSPHNLLLNSRLAGAVAGTPGTAPTSWGLGFSTGVITAVSTDGLTFSAAAQRIVLTQSVSVSAGSVYSVTCVVRSNSGLEFSRLLLINQVITGATSTRFANGSSVAPTYVPQAGDRIEERLTTTTNSGSMQVRVGVGCDTADTGTAKLDLIRVQQGIDSGAADDLSTITTTAARYLPFPGTQAPASYLPGPWNDLTRTSLATVIGADGLVGYGPANIQPQSDDYASAQWTKRGTATVTSDQIASPFDGVRADRVVLGAVTVNDMFSANYTMPAGPWVPSLWIKKNQPTGILRVLQGSGAHGNIAINFSLLSDAWERITPTHPAVSVSGAFVGTTAYDALQLGSDSAETIDFYMCRVRAQPGIVSDAAADGSLLTTTAARYLPRQDYDQSQGADGAPYALVEDYGVERVTNVGGPFTSLSNWSAFFAAQSLVSGEIFVERNGTGSPPRSETPFPTVPGKTYVLRCRVRSQGSTSVSINARQSSSPWPVLSSVSGVYTTPTEVVLYFVAASTETLIQVEVPNTAGAGAYVSSASAREYLGTVAKRYGPDLLLNGTFATGLENWTQVLGAMSHVNGRLRASRAAGSSGRIVSSPIPCVIGRTYRVDMTAYVGTMGTANWYVGISATSQTGAIHSGSTTVDGPVSFSFIATQTTHWLACQAAQAGADGLYTEFDNISVREYPRPDDFGGEAVLNGAFANGATYWSTSGSASISTGVATLPNQGSSNLSSFWQDVAFQASRTYRVVVAGSGQVNYRTDLSSALGPVTLPATLYVTSSGVNPRLQFFNVAGVATSITSVSVNEFLVTAEATYGAELVTNADDRTFSADTGYWTKGTDWTISSGAAGRLPSAGSSNLTRGSLLVIGKTYLVTFSGTISAGQLGIYAGSSSSVFLSPGTYTNKTVLLTCAGSTGLFLQASGAIASVSIDDVSVKEYLGTIPTGAPYTAAEQYGAELLIDGGFDGTLGGLPWAQRSIGTGTASFSGGVASIAGTDGANRGWFTQAFSATVGATYRVRVTGATVTGQVFVLFGTATGTGLSPALTTGAQRDYYVTAAGTTINVGLQTGSGSGSGSFASLSVQEYLGTVTTGTPKTVAEPYGPELVADGSFTSGISGWSSNGSPALAHVSNALQIATAGGSAGAYRDYAVTPGRQYRVAATWSSNGAASLRAYDGAGFGVLLAQTAELASASDLPCWPVAQSTTMRVYLRNTDNCVSSFDNVSVKEYRGDLVGGLGVEMVVNGAGTSLAGWTLVGAGGAMAVASGAFEITGNGGGYPGIRQTINGLTVGRAYLLICRARQGTTSAAVTVFAGGANRSISSTAPTPVAFLFVATATSTNVEILLNAGAASGTGYVDSISVKEYLPVSTAGTPRALGLRSEGSSANLTQRWNTFTDGARWFTNGPALGDMVKAGVAAGPDGIAGSASRLLFTGAEQLLRNPAVGVVAGDIVSASWWVKGTAGETILFAVGGVDSLFTLTGAWQRLVSNGRTAVNDNTILSTFGGATARSLLIYGCTTVKAPFIGSDIPNDGTGSAARVVDDWFLSGDALDAALGAGRSTFTIYMEWDCPAVTISDRRILYVGNAAGTRRLLIAVVTPDPTRAFIYVDDGTTAGFSGTTATLLLGQVNKVCVSVTPTSVGGAVNGASFGAALSRTFGGPAHAERLYLLQDPEITKAQGSTVRRARTMPDIALTIAQMQALTA